MSSNINDILKNTSQPAKSGILQTIMQFLPILLLVGIVIFSFYRNKEEEKKKKNILESLTVGESVQTMSGIIGTITFISPDRKIVEIRTGIDLSNKIFVLMDSIVGKVDQKAIDCINESPNQPVA